MKIIRRTQGRNMKKKSEFMEWFIAQHGRAPIGNRTERELRDRMSEGLYAADTLRRQEIYDARKESALYAWNARKP